jgi:(1->4)-alpha-D-glucan 1-alpha-D-glucosylmutase
MAITGQEPLSASAPHVQRRLPRATYRLQFNAGFTLDDAAGLVDYLDLLGVSDIYASPLFTARAGSPHGYDITDHGSINPDIGGEAAFERLHQTLNAHGMGLLLDVVPNHMGVGDLRNVWWMDVLENGPSSIYAPYFDIDWDPVPAQLQNKVLLPVLGDQYGNVLERGELQLRFEEGAFTLHYWQHVFPVAPRSYYNLLSHRLDALIARLGPDHPDVQELQSILTAISYLPHLDETAYERVLERNREKEIIKRRLKELTGRSPVVAAAIVETVVRYNGVVGDPASFDLLDELISRQPYRLAFWRVAAEEINYRRFFDINDLAAIRVELPEVFYATHSLVFRLLAEGRVQGLRIDHPDGLWDPAAYFRQLQEGYLACLAVLSQDDKSVSCAEAVERERDWIDRVLAESASFTPPRWPLYVVAEKILANDELLPEDWAVAGTTGYDFLNEVNAIFVDSSARRHFDRLYTDVTGPQLSFANLVNAKKKEIMLVALASEVNTLSHLLDRLTEANRHYRDFTLNSLTFAIREVLAALPVYRTYIRGPDQVTPLDERVIEVAVREARRRNPRTAREIFDFVRDTLLLRNLESFAPEARPDVLRFVMKFQQLSGPVMAKGVEDTAFYVYNRLVSLNEVGGHPEHFGLPVDVFHRRAAHRAQHWPASLLATSTHDTKRSEDVRARIHVLSEMPQEWRAVVGRWSRYNTRKKTSVEGRLLPLRDDEYLLYQTLVGVWPDLSPDAAVSALPADFVMRIVQYMEKATREAKVNTSWINPNEVYDNAISRFVEGILDPRRSRRFLESLASFSQRVAYFGRFNSLAQALIKLTAPGVPDIYQGCELWDLSLVDPDNRRPVDYARRRRLLAEVRERMAMGDRRQPASEWLAQAVDGRVKLFVIVTALELRREHPTLFAEGAYVPLSADGPHAGHVVAFARRSAAAESLTVTPRLCLRLTKGEERPPIGEVWEDTWLPLPDVVPGSIYHDRLTGARLPVVVREGATGLWLREALATFPLALLQRDVADT